MGSANPIPVRNIRIDDETWDAARDCAEDLEISTAEFVRASIDIAVKARTKYSARTTPDTTISASKINDQMSLFARIGYREWRMSIKPEHSYLESYNRTDLKRISELRGEPIFPPLALALARDAEQAGWAVETQATDTERRVTCTSPDGKQVIKILHTNGKFTEATVTFTDQSDRAPVKLRNVSAARHQITDPPYQRPVKE